MIETELSRCVATFHPGATGVTGAAKLSGGASQETWTFDIVHPDGTIGAILRRIPAPEMHQPKFLTLGALRYDIDKGELWQGDVPLRLTGTEQALLRRLAASKGEPVSRADLIDDLGRGTGDEAENSERAIDVQITRLRRKIEPDPREPRYLQTVRGVGYMLAPD